jgi:hypothetical protein
MIKLLRNIGIIMAILYFSKPIQPKIMQGYVDNMLTEATKFASQYIDKDMIKNAYKILESVNSAKQDKSK